MITPIDMSPHIKTFLESYDATAQDKVWLEISGTFRQFWNDRVLRPDGGTISDADCDQIIRYLDRNAKGNTKSSQAVAKAMVPQGAWRRMLNEFHSNAALGGLVNRILTEADSTAKAKLIDELYRINAGQGNNLTGPSGNTVGAYLAIYDPFKNLGLRGNEWVEVDHLPFKSAAALWSGP